MKPLFFFCLLLPMLANAQVEVEISLKDASSNRSLVELKATNSSDKNVRNARVVVMMMDDEGKVVGTQSQWLQDPNQVGTDSSKHPAVLNSGEERSFNVVVETNAKATQSKVICSRMVYADGTIADPNRDFKTVKKVTRRANQSTAIDV